MKFSAIIGALSLGLLAFGSSATWAAGPVPVSVAQDPNAVGTPVGKRGPTTVKFALEVQEVNGVLDAATKTSFTYWTFNGKVPGPMLRARVGDTIEITLSNPKTNMMPHNVDLHAVWGQGGGAEKTNVAPGETKSFVFKALAPGLYVYHCAAGVIPQHISSGMYGMILIEPEGGLPKVDKEFYVMQGEIYSEGAAPHKDFSQDKLMAEQPNNVMMNASVGGLGGMKVKVGDNVRIFFGDGGPNLISSFHAIGTIWEKVYPEGAIDEKTVLRNVQTTVVPVAGSTIVEFKAHVPAKYILVDHSLTRLLKGNAGIIEAVGAEQPEIYRAGKLDDKPAAKAAAKK